MFVKAKVTFKLPQQDNLQPLTCGPSGHVNIESEVEGESNQ